MYYIASKSSNYLEPCRKGPNEQNKSTVKTKSTGIRQKKIFNFVQWGKNNLIDGK